MRIVVYDDYRLGVLSLDGASVIDLTDLAPRFSPPSPEFAAMTAQLAVSELIRDFDRLRSQIGKRIEHVRGVPLQAVQLRPPLPRPGKIFCMGVNYKEYIEAPQQPILVFIKPSDCVLQPGGVLELPDADFSICHHEPELAVVIGNGGRNIASSDAMGHIFGYTCAVDVSCRGSFGGNSFIGKSFDGCCPIGPCITTRDEISDPYALRIRFWVADQLRQNYPVSDMDRRIPECIEYVSSVSTLLPGDILLLGTNHQGIGPLQDGDTATMDVDEIGALSFHVSDPLRRSWPRQVDEATAAHMRRRRSELARSAVGPVDAGQVP